MSADGDHNAASTVEPSRVLAPTATALQRKEGDVFADGYSTVHLGDRYYGHHNIFEMGTNAGKTTARASRAELLRLLAYNGMDLKRSQLAAVRTTQASFKWINDTLYPRWLTNPKAKPLWIQGKPASGKSMLMKHLAESRETYNQLAASVPLSSGDVPAGYATTGSKNIGTKSKDTLRTHSEAFPHQQWQILHFYFDYRIGASLGNTIIGMMKHFLWQLCSDISAVAQDLIEDSYVLVDADVESYITALSRVMVKHKLFACAFIDGLDEYGGDLGHLCSHIEDLSSRSGIKLCLASRPDNPLTAALLDMGCEVILMQEHNLPAIRASIDYKLSCFEASNPHSAGWFPQTLRQAIAERAEGIFLWASLVVDQMTFHVKNSDEPEKDLKAFLSSLPNGLQELYDRILRKIKPHNQGDAALILKLLFEHELALPGQGCSPVVLFQAWNYIGCFINGGRQGPSEIPADLYQARLKDILGNLIEFFLVANRQAVRLLHKTLKEFLDHSQWIDHCLPETVKHEIPGRVWINLAFRIFDWLGDTLVEKDLKFSDYITKLVADAVVQNSYEVKNQLEHNKSPLYHIYAHVHTHYIKKLPDLKPWSSLIVFCLRSFFSFHNSTEESIQEPYHAHLNSAMIILHAANCSTCLPDTDQIPWIMGRLHSGLSNEFLPMALATAHKIDYWSQERVARSMERIKHLGHHVMQDTFDIFIWSCLKKTQLSRFDSSVFEAFASEACFLGGRHVCALGWDSAFGRLVYRRGRHYVKEMQPHHDRDCPDRSTLPSPAHHWLTAPEVDVNESTKQLELLILLGLDLRLCFRLEGGVLRAILQQLSMDRDVRKATAKFLAWTLFTWTIDLDDLQFVAELQQQASCQNSWWHIPGTRNTENEVYSRLLSRLVKVLRKCHDCGTWDVAILETIQQSANLPHSYISQRAPKYYPSRMW